MSLKENYKNDIYQGNRKYQTVQNEDGTISLRDVTVYTQEGDIFSADDFNATNRAVNAIDKDNTAFRSEIMEDVQNLETQVGAFVGETLLSFSASGWSSTAPYTQTVSFAGIKESDTPVYGLRLTGTLSNVTVEAQKLAWGYIDRIASGNGRVTAYCYSKKPGTNITVSAKGVSNG